jgi:septal ring factor EnvC (AmiA/AmiB activator)
MSPDSTATILRYLERLNEKVDANADVLHDTRSEVREVKVIANAALNESEKTNGRVSAIEEREAEARGEKKEHDRMEKKAHEADQERDGRSAKWRNMGPNILTGLVTGLTVVAAAFVLERL